MSAERIERLREEMADAIEAGDPSTALLKVRALRALIDTLPDSGGAVNTLNWFRNLDRTEASLIRQVNASNGVVTRVPIKHARPDALEEC